MEKREPLDKNFNKTRHHRRFPVETLGIRIKARAATEPSSHMEAYKAKMLNLGGVLMEGDRLYVPESRLMMEIAFPEEVHISVTGRVTSCFTAKNSRGRRYEVGIEFLSMSEEDQAKLKKFIHWLYLKDAGFTE